MTSEQYNKMLPDLNSGNLLVENDFGNAVTADPNDFIEMFIDDLKPDVSMRSNISMTNELITEIKNKFNAWDVGVSIDSKLVNLYWINRILKRMGSDTDIIYPTYDDLKNLADTAMYTKTMLPVTYKIYCSIISTNISLSMEYIFDKVDVTLSKGCLLGPDGSYLDIDTGRTMVGTEPTKPMELPDTYISTNYVKLNRDYTVGNHDPYAILNSLINMAIATSHNAKYIDVTIKDIKSAIRMDKLLPMSDRYTVDVGMMEEYLKDLTENIYHLTNSAKEHKYESPDDMFNIYFDNYRLKCSDVPEIENIDHTKGITVVLDNDILTVTVDYKDLSKFKLFEAQLNYNNNGEGMNRMVSKIYDLSLGFDNDIGRLIVSMLDKLMLLDYYIQPPTLSDKTISDFLSYSQPVVIHGTDLKVDNDEEYYYLIIGGMLHIGILTEEEFSGAIMLSTVGEKGKLSSIITFREPPKLRILDDEAKADLESKVGPKAYAIITNTLMLNQENDNEC